MQLLLLHSPNISHCAVYLKAEIQKGIVKYAHCIFI